MLRTAIYIRKSSDEASDKQIQSLERQWKDISEFIEKYNAVVQVNERISFNPDNDVVYEEYSAKKPWRPKFNDLILKIKKNKYDVLLCHELSRLSRNSIDNWVLVHVLDEENLKEIRTISSVFKNTPSDKFTLSLFLNVAKFENDQRWINTASWMQTRKSKGGTTNKANMGYKNVGTTKANRWIEKDGENFDILRKCWEMLLIWEYKIIDLYDYAKSQWFTYIKSIKTWEELRSVPSEWWFRHAFSNTYYKGYIKTEKGEMKWNHPQMVTEEEFEKAQLILQKYWFKHSKEIEIKYENILERLLMCWKSNNPFYVDIKTRYYCPTKWCGNRYYSAVWPKECTKCHKNTPLDKYKKIENYKYFAVRGAKHTIPWKKEAVSNIDIKYIEDLIDAELMKIHISDKLFGVLRKRMYTLWVNEESKLKLRIKDKRKDIEKKEDDISNILKNSYSQESVSDTIRGWLELTIDRLKDEIKDIESEISDFSDELERSFEQAWQSLNWLLDARKIFWKWSPDSFEPKRNLLLFFFSNLKFIDGKIYPEWKEPFSTIANWAILTKQKSQTQSEISDWWTEWLPELDSNQWPTG